MNNTDRVLEYLRLHCPGAANARTKKRIAKDLFGDESFARSVEQAINDLLKRQNERICSSCHKPFGYYIPLNSDESGRYVMQIKSRLDELTARYQVAQHNHIMIQREEFQSRRLLNEGRQEFFGCGML